jgi:hypothetical protein
MLQLSLLHFEYTIALHYNFWSTKTPELLDSQTASKHPPILERRAHLDGTHHSQNKEMTGHLSDKSLSARLLRY